jgi:hypothetical protein
VPPFGWVWAFFLAWCACLVCSILFLRRKWLGQHTQSQEPHFVTKMNAHRRSFLSSSEKKPVQTNKRQWIEKKPSHNWRYKNWKKSESAPTPKNTLAGTIIRWWLQLILYNTTQPTAQLCLTFGENLGTAHIRQQPFEFPKEKKKPRAIVYFVFSPAITQLASSD